MVEIPAVLERGGLRNAHASGTKSIAVLHIVTGLQTGGTERMIQKLLRRREPGVRQSVVQLQAGGAIAEQMRDEGIAVTDLGLTPSLAGVFGLWRLVRLAAHLRPDVIQTWLYHADLAGALVGPLLRCPVVWNVRGSEHPGMTGPLVRACAALSRVPALVIANAESGRVVHERAGYKPRAWRIVPNGFDITVFRPNDLARASVRSELGLPTDAALIGMVARSDPLKDHAVFISAMRRVLHEVPRAYALLVGEGMNDQNPIFATIDETLRGRIIGLGRRDDMARLTAALDVACLTSVSEGFPNVIGEAMACEIPCVATDAGESRAIIGDTGVVVPPRDVDGIANGVIALLCQSEQKRRLLGQRARLRIIEHYSIEAVSATYLDLYRGITGTN